MFVGQIPSLDERVSRSSVRHTLYLARRTETTRTVGGNHHTNRISRTVVQRSVLLSPIHSHNTRYVSNQTYLSQQSLSVERNRIGRTLSTHHEFHTYLRQRRILRLLGMVPQSGVKALLCLRHQSRPVGSGTVEIGAEICNLVHGCPKHGNGNRTPTPKLGNNPAAGNCRDTHKYSFLHETFIRIGYGWNFIIDSLSIFLHIGRQYHRKTFGEG